MSTPKIVRIMQGLPGSGKSWWIDKRSYGFYPPIASPEQIIRCSADDYHINEQGFYEFRLENAAGAHRQCFLKYEEALKVNSITYIFVDNTNTRMWELAPYYRLAEVRNFDVKILTFLCPLSISIERNIHKVPIPTLLAMDRALREEIIPSFWKREFVLVKEDGSYSYYGI